MLLLIVTMTGCVTTRLSNARSVVERHPEGFADAVKASPEATEFVRDALKTINALEREIESR